MALLEGKKGNTRFDQSEGSFPASRLSDGVIFLKIKQKHSGDDQEFILKKERFMCLIHHL